MSIETWLFGLVSDNARQLEIVRELWVIDSCKVRYKGPICCRVMNQASVFSIQSFPFLSLSVFLSSILGGLADLESSYTTKPLNSILTIFFGSKFYNL